MKEDSTFGKILIIDDEKDNTEIDKSDKFFSPLVKNIAKKELKSKTY